MKNDDLFNWNSYLTNTIKSIIHTLQMYILIFAVMNCDINTKYVVIIYTYTECKHTIVIKYYNKRYR